MLVGVLNLVVSLLEMGALVACLIVLRHNRQTIAQLFDLLDPLSVEVRDERAREQEFMR